MHRRATLLLASLSAIILGGCTNTSRTTHGTNSLKIYNAQHHRVYAATGRRSNTIVANIPQDYHHLSNRKVPRMAKPSYRYVMHHARNDFTLTMQVYSNYHYAKLTGIPVVGSGLVKLTDKNFQKLNHPQPFTN